MTDANGNDEPNRSQESDDTPMPRQIPSQDGPEVDASVLAVSAIDDETRTHLDNPDETDTAQSGDGTLEHVDEEEQGGS